MKAVPDRWERVDVLYGVVHHFGKPIATDDAPHWFSSWNDAVNEAKARTKNTQRMHIILELRINGIVTAPEPIYTSSLAGPA